MAVRSSLHKRTHRLYERNKWYEIENDLASFAQDCNNTLQSMYSPLAADRHASASDRSSPAVQKDLLVLVDLCSHCCLALAVDWNTRRPVAHFDLAKAVVVVRSRHCLAGTYLTSASHVLILNLLRQMRCPHSRRLGYLVLSWLDFEAVVENSDWPFELFGNTHINRFPIDSIASKKNSGVYSTLCWFRRAKAQLCTRAMCVILRWFVLVFLNEPLKNRGLRIVYSLAVQTIRRKK